jgi:hypothetical protein
MNEKSCQTIIDFFGAGKKEMRNYLKICEKGGNNFLTIKKLSCNARELFVRLTCPLFGSEANFVELRNFPLHSSMRVLPNPPGQYSPPEDLFH